MKNAMCCEKIHITYIYEIMVECQYGVSGLIFDVFGYFFHALHERICVETENWGRGGSGMGSAGKIGIVQQMAVFSMARHASRHPPPPRSKKKETARELDFTSQGFLNVIFSDMGI